MNKAKLANVEEHFLGFQNEEFIKSTDELQYFLFTIHHNH